MIISHNLHSITNFAVFNWTNPWLVGIGTALISGLAVNFISRSLWSRREDGEYRQKVDAANSEVLYALRPSVAEASMPSKEIIESLAKATARKYALKRQSLMTLDEYADGMIKEVMDSSFISHSQKVKYCNEITTIKSMSKRATQTSRLGSADPYYAYRQRVRIQATYILSISTALMVMVTVFTATSVLKGVSPTIIQRTLPLVAIAAIVPVVGTLVLSAVRQNQKLELKEMERAIYKVESKKHDSNLRKK